MPSRHRNAFRYSSRSLTKGNFSLRHLVETEVKRSVVATYLIPGGSVSAWESHQSVLTILVSHGQHELSIEVPPFAATTRGWTAMNMPGRMPRAAGVHAPVCCLQQPRCPRTHHLCLRVQSVCRRVRGLQGRRIRAEQMKCGINA